MLNRKCFMGIAILVLTFGFLSVAFGITNTPSADQTITSNASEAQNFSIKVDKNATVTWFLNGTKVKDGANVTANETSLYSNASAAAGFWNVSAISSNASNPSETAMTRWLWTVTSPAPILSTSPIVTSQNVDLITDTNASVTFNVNQSNSISRILYGTVPSLSTGSWSAWNNNTPSPRKINLPGLIQNTTYYYSIYVYNTSNQSLGTNYTIQNFTTVNPTKPNITSVTNGIATVNSVNITIGVDPVDSYLEVRYGETTLSESKWLNTSVPPKIIQLINLTAGKSYNYNVFAYNKTNQTFSTNSSIQNFTTRFPGPTISSINPTNATQEMMEGDSRNLTVTIGSQGGNLSWYENNNTAPLNSTILNANESVTYTFKRTKGTYKITANISNTNGSDTRVWTMNVRSTSYSTGNRIWDGSRPNDFSLTYSWNPMSFSGFYYNAKDEVGNENITVTMAGYSSRTIEEDKLIYRTSPQEVSFSHSGFGKYQVIGFMADSYFAGYTVNTNRAKTRPTTDFVGKSAVSQGQLHKVLIDEDIKRTISVGGTLALKEGYVLKATDIDLTARTMLLSLLKDGNEVDVSPLSADETYVYAKTVGGVETLPLIMVRFDSVFSGQEMQVAFLKGLFQISDNPTIIKVGNDFGNMEVSAVNAGLIEMRNSGDISLNKGSTADIMGDVKIKVADNDSAVRFALSVEKTGDFEVRSTVYSDTNPITEWTPYNFGMNVGDKSIGFYYDLDDGVGSENLTLKSKVSGRSIPDGDLLYSTSPQEVKFTHTGFGRYQVIGFMADKYFAGYTSNTGTSSGIPIITRPTTDFEGISTLANGALHKVLIDDDAKTTISVGGTIALKEGYVLKATDIDLRGRTMLLSLLKDGTEVDVTPLSAGETYVYTKTVGGTESLPLIMVRFESVFAGQELQAAFLKGIFQISDSPTTVKVGDQFGEMEVRSVTGNIITMSNDGDIGLDKNKNDALMGNLRLKVADNDTALRFYFAVDVTAEMRESQLVIDAPTKIMAGDALKIKVTAGGKPVDNSSIALDTDIGFTDSNGELNYSIPKTLQPGMYNITAVKTGYEKATKNIEIEKYVDYRLSIEAPSKADQGETITIKVLYNGTAMSDASVIFDNTSAGTTDSNGEVKYKLETSGTHSITASKTSYISVSRDIDIRAPYSEFKALDLNITPNPVFTDEDFVVRSNITNAGTKSDTLPVDLIVNGTAVDTRSVTLGAGENAEINFTRREAAAANVTVEVLGQTSLLVVQEKPTSYLLIAAIATGIGAVIIYVLTSKGLLNLEILKQKFGELSQKFSLPKKK